VITADSLVWPYNAVEAIAERATTLDEHLFVTQRPLRSSDPLQSVGVFGMQWEPDESSFEMRGLPGGVHQPTLTSYLLGIQAFVKDTDEVRGAAVHGTLSRMVRTMLVTDPALRVSLRALSVTTSGYTERTQRFGVRTQRYLSNEIEGSWLYLSTIEFWIETETT
jgi:hypothetical protein